MTPRRFEALSDSYLIETSIEAYLAKDWEIIVLHETLTLSPTIATAWDELYQDDSISANERQAFIQKQIKSQYLDQIEALNAHTHSLKRKLETSAEIDLEDLSLLAREYLSIFHVLRAELEKSSVLNGIWN